MRHRPGTVSQMTELDYNSFPDHLRVHVPGFDRVCAQHISDYQGVLPHVLLGDLVRFLSNEVRVRGPQSPALRNAMDLLERAMGSADPRLQELVAVSFLENLDEGDAGFVEIIKRFGPSLEEQHQRSRGALRV